jgi:hypothetical protein
MALNCSPTGLLLNTNLTGINKLTLSYYGLDFRHGIFSSQIGNVNRNTEPQGASFAHSRPP